MNSHKQLATVAIFAALACTGLRAQTANLYATIPFDFNAGSKQMPAGEYVIHGAGSIVYLHGVDNGSPNVVLMTAAAIDRGRLQKARLDFNRYGNRYFLTAVWDSFTHEGRHVFPTDREKELAKRGDVAAQTAVSLVGTK